MWDFPIQTDKTLEHNWTDTAVIDKSKKCLLTDPACPFVTHIERKEKCTNYTELTYEIAKLWKMTKVKVIPVVTEALGTVTKHIEINRKIRLGLEEWSITEATFTSE